MTALPVFSEAWAAACAARINGSEAYRAAAAGWEGVVFLRMAGNSGEIQRGVLLDLWHGECRSARAADGDGEAAARYVLSGTAGAWRQVLTAQIPPLMAIITGKIRLTRGSLLELVPYVNAAQELVRVIASIQADFPPAQ
ncbi:MAG TPA: hypothetical protein VH879_11455 [Gemmatimonadales bacterium]|jgi:putative sterol carrier protein